MHETLTVRTTRRTEFIDITAAVRNLAERRHVTTGRCTVYVPHTTAGVTINEHADPDVASDITAALETIVPDDGAYRHAEGNSPAHIRASLMGSSATVMIEEGKLLLGTWQGIFFAEFDGPRTREVWVRISADR
jgi:secondary thiamine-phosphate synthase enzyme